MSLHHTYNVFPFYINEEIVTVTDASPDALYHTYNVIPFYTNVETVTVAGNR